MPRKTFNYSGEWKKFVVPRGVKVLSFTVRGAGSGSRQGGYVDGSMRVRPGDVLWITAGQAGDLRYGSGNRKGGEKTWGGGGAGGDGRGTGEGGNGGGGASAVRVRTKNGWKYKIVAGGAGGTGGGDNDNALGGRGGDKTGEIGRSGCANRDPSTQECLDPPEVSEAATGGTQTQGGKGGTSAMGTAYYGARAENSQYGRAGRGSSGPAAEPNVHGGGGGGGGWRAGGGGAAGRIGYSPSTGGGGGSNFTGGLYNHTSTQGGGGTGHGQVIISWVDPNTANQPPVPPDDIKIDGKPISAGLATKATRSVTLTGTPDDPDQKQGVRLYVRVSNKKNFSKARKFKGTYDEQNKRDSVRITGLSQETLYYVRIHTQDNHGRISRNYRSTSFWTNRAPSYANLISPPENAQFTNLLNITFIWNHVDPDPSDGPTGFKLRYRTAKTPNYPAGPWVVKEMTGTSFEQWTMAAGTFLGNTLYEWQVKTRDQQGLWGNDWSDSRSFYVTAETTSPYLKEPGRDEAIVAAEDNLFEWQYRHPIKGVSQDRADIRYRAVGAEGMGVDGDADAPWTVLTGDSVTPGSEHHWLIPADTFEPGIKYEWQARTYADGDALPSDWSSSKKFWAITDASSDSELIDSGEPQRPLGIGNNRVFVYDRKGKVMRGELTPLVTVRWGRKRDDISHCNIFMDEWDKETRQFLGTLRTWRHELVVFRDGVRVWEGPITRISGSRTNLEIEAWDVMAYIYRRIMRQGYNDSFRIINGQQVGMRTVVDRAARIIKNCLAYDDPNLLAHLTPIDYYDDARQTRVVLDYTKTAWEEIDDLAAHAGLDYTVVGRRIVLWDTHRPIGRLPEMRDGDFSDSPIVTEYGMSAANHFGVTNGAGVWGAWDEDKSDHSETGYIEQLASAYGESEAPVADAGELTRKDREKLEENLTEQAHRNIEGRWPPPLVVRIPDNSTLSPDLNLGINQLVPGVWIPLRASNTVREVAQWQKLDSIDVEQTAQGERITAVLSPAPNSGEDPDSGVETVTE
jgi:hypothetical protein